MAMGPIHKTFLVLRPFEGALTCLILIAGTQVMLRKAYTVIFFRPKLREFLRFPLNRNFARDFVFFAKPEISVSQNHTKNSGPKFRLLIPDRIREKFDSDF
jgi:hypothetical protein